MRQSSLGIQPPTTIPTRPCVSIKIFPPFAEFIEFGGASRHVITNDGSNRIVFKVKCSNNVVFKVSPVYSFLDSGASTELQILRKEGPSKHDKLVIIVKEAKKSDKDARSSFESDLSVYKYKIPLVTRTVVDEPSSC